MAKYLNLTGLQTLWTKIKAVFAPKENGVYYVPGTSGYANWSANTAYAVGANVVNPSGECWTCKTAHTSGSSWSSTNWNRISAVALTGTIDGVTALYAGLKIAYRFQVLGGEGSTTLNVNNLGAKAITRGTGAFYRWTIGRNGVAILVYDGSAWRFGDYDSNDQYVLPDAYCSTAAGTQAKAAISIGFSYSRHNNIPFRIYFTNANTYDGNLTLNVNSQGAKPLWINGSASSSSNKTIAVGVYWCYYDGTQFQLWTDKSVWNYKYRGDGSNLTETFSAASSRANIASGESNATIFGKIAKWFSDLKALAFKDKVGTGDVESGTYGISVSGNAATATKATQDSDGNAINATYFKSSGNVTLVSGTSTKIGTQNGTDVKITLPTIPAAANNGALQLQLNGGSATSKFTANQSGNSTLSFSIGSTAGTFKVDSTEISIAGFTKVESSSTNGNIKINGTETTVYTHPTTAGNKHIPSGGSSGQFLGWDSEGTAKWVSNPNSDTKVKATAKSDNVNYKILATASASPTSGNATEAVYDTDISLNPSTNTISANISGSAARATYGSNVNLDSQSVSLLTKVKELGQNNLHYARFFTSGDGGASNITDRPVTGAEGFVCEAIASRRVSSSDYRYQLIYWRRDINVPYYANITTASTSISWVQGITSSNGYGGGIAMGSGNGNTLERSLSYKVEVVLEDGGAAQSGWKLCVSDSVGSDDQTIYFT